MTDLTQDLAALGAALYMGPTPEQWQALRPDPEGGVTVAGPGGVPIAKCCHATSVLDENYAYVIGYCEAIANAHFIAACSPDRIRRLLDYIRGLALDAARYRWLRQRWGRVTETYDGDSGRIVEIGTEPGGEGWDIEPGTLDAAIDAAMEKEARND